MEINSIGSTAMLSGMRPAADSIPVLSAPASGMQPVTANAVKATGAAEKAVTGKKATDREAADSGEPARMASVDKEAIRQSLASLSRASGLEFAVDDELGRVVVKVVDAETREVLKQFPSEEALALARSLHDGRSSLHRAEA